MKLTTLLSLLAIAGLPVPRGSGAEEVKPCPLRTKTFWIPPGFIGDSPNEGTDVRELLKEAGIEIPAAGEARFFAGSSRLVIRATSDVIEQVRAFVRNS